MSNLPELIGSEKQIKWANDIRDRLIRDNSEQMDNPTLREALVITSAKWWIETRNLDMIRFTVAVSEMAQGGR